MNRLKITALFIFIFYQLSFGQKPNEFWEKVIETSLISDTDLRIKEAIKLQRKKESKKEIKDSVYAKIFHIIGRAYWKNGEIEKSLFFTKKAIEINLLNNSLTNKRHLALSIYNLASIQFDIADYEQAIYNFDNSINLLKKWGKNERSIPMAYLMKSTILFFMGDYSSSIINSEQAIFLSNNFYDVKLPAMISKAQALIEINKLAEGEELLKIIKKMVKKEDGILLSNIFFLFGKIYSKTGNYKQAFYNYYESVKLNNTNNDNQNNADAYITIADLLITQKKYLQATSALKKSISFSEGNKIYILRAMDRIAMIMALQNNFRESFALFQKALSMDTIQYKQNPRPQIIIGKTDNDVLFDLVKHKAETWLAYYHHTNKKEYLEYALETFLVADKMVDYMRREHVGYQSKLYWRDKTHGLYENALETCFLLKNYEKAFYFLEKSRAVLLNDKLNTLNASQLLTEADQIKERVFQKQIAEINAKLNQETREELKAKLNINLLDVQEHQAEFIKTLAQKQPTYFAIKYDTSMSKLADFKQYLQKRGASFIGYFRGDSANYQLVINGNELKIIKQKSHENIFDFLKKSSSLNKRVIVSQDGAFIPLDTLVDNSGNHLLKKYAFSFTYSAQYLLKNVDKNKTASWFNSFIGFAPVNYSKSMDLTSLFGADKALDEVSNNYFWPKNYLNEKAVKANFQKNAANYSVIQLFTHADANNNNQEPTIFFADSALKLSEIESFNKFNTQLLVLSACKTNVGFVAKGEGTLSLAREFAGLGIPATITTLWSVENETTYHITKLFYKYLGENEPKDIALQKAKLEYLAINSKEKQLPIYWSAFVLMGESSPLIIMQKLYIQGIITIFTLLLVGVIFLFYKKKVKNSN